MGTMLTLHFAIAASALARLWRAASFSMTTFFLPRPPKGTAVISKACSEPEVMDPSRWPERVEPLERVERRLFGATDPRRDHSPPLFSFDVFDVPDLTEACQEAAADRSDAESEELLIEAELEPRRCRGCCTEDAALMSGEP